MNKSEIKAILSGCLEAEDVALDPPSKAGWEILERKFSTSFPIGFVYFMELMAEYSFPGDILNVRCEGRTNGNDTIAAVYDAEMAYGSFPSYLVPFYSVGNGDYFALNAKERELSAVYYYYHEDGRVEQVCSNIDEWIMQLPAFLA